MQKYKNVANKKCNKTCQEPINNAIGNHADEKSRNDNLFIFTGEEDLVPIANKMMSAIGINFIKILNPTGSEGMKKI